MKQRLVQAVATNTKLIDGVRRPSYSQEIVRKAAEKFDALKDYKGVQMFVAGIGNFFYSTIIGTEEDREVEIHSDDGIISYLQSESELNDVYDQLRLIVQLKQTFEIAGEDSFITDPALHDAEESLCDFLNFTVVGERCSIIEKKTENGEIRRILDYPKTIQLYPHGPNHDNKKLLFVLPCLPTHLLKHFLVSTIWQLTDKERILIVSNNLSKIASIDSFASKKLELVFDGSECFEMNPINLYKFKV